MSCTHLELVADSLVAEDLLRFYNQVCGMSYMFTRLRKEHEQHQKQHYVDQQCQHFW